MSVVRQLGPSDVHVLQCQLDEAPLADGWVSAEEARRAARLHRPLERDRFISGRTWLRRTLGLYVGASPQDIRFDIGAYGKPALAAPHAWLQFNLSHAGSLALLAVTRGRDVGVDVEAMRPIGEMAVIARRQFAQPEWLQWSGLPADQRVQAFYACWTRKEAYLKAVGAGLSLPLDSFEVAFEPGRPASLLSIDGSAPRAADWSMWAFEAEAEFCAAVVARGTGLNLRHIDQR